MVARSVPVLMASFVFCWFPNHAVTLWGILVVFYLVPWDSTFYTIHTFFFSLSSPAWHTATAASTLCSMSSLVPASASSGQCLQGPLVKACVEVGDG